VFHYQFNVMISGFRARLDVLNNRRYVLNPLAV